MNNLFAKLYRHIVPLRLRKQLVTVKTGLTIRKNYKKTRKKIKRGKNINVIFFVQFPEMWNSYKTIYERLVKEPNINVSILTLPKRSSTEEFSFKNTNEAFVYFKSIGISAVDGFENNRLLDITSLDPDLIFISRPYDNDRPNQYSLHALFQNGLICYVPYSGRLTKGIHLSIEFDLLINYFYIIFADCKDAKEYIQRKIKKFAFKKYRKIFDVGYPRFDLLTDVANKKENNTIKRVLWLPRWSVSKHNNISHFYDYFGFLMDYFNVNRDMELIIRPHPLMFKNFIQTGFKTEKEVEDTLSQINRMNNVHLDDNVDYLKTFSCCDLLISDSTSLLLEFFFYNKPVIVLDEDIKPLTDYGEELMKTFYLASNTDELLGHLTALVSGQDSHCFSRDSLLQKMKLKHTDIGNRIVDILFGCFDL